MEQQIFKLIFEHDMRLDKLAERNTHRNPQESGSSLEDFMKPDPTYSKFYLTGTDLANEQFGLNQLIRYPEITEALESAFPEHKLYTAEGRSDENLRQTVEDLGLGEVVVLSDKGVPSTTIESLHVDVNSNVGHLKSELKEALEEGLIVIYKEQAKNGFDLHIFSKKNIYRDMFFPLQQMLPDAFRFFSINGKKFRSERHFYFETWTLQQPPHGFEEVFPESVL